MSTHKTDDKENVPPSSAAAPAPPPPLILKPTEPESGSSALAIWTEDIILDPGTVRYPIRVVIVDNHMITRFDRLVRLPKDSTTFIYRVLDHGIPWQHLDSGLSLDEVKKQLISLSKGKRLVMYDAWRTIGLFNFSEQQLSRMKICDLKASSAAGPESGAQVQQEEEPLSFWQMVNKKLGHEYSGKPGNYDTLELADFVMQMYLKM